MVYTRHATWADSPSTTTPITAAKLEDIEAALEGSVAGHIRKHLTSQQTTTTDMDWVRVTLAGTTINDGGSDLSGSTSNRIEVLRDGRYVVSGQIAVGSAARGGDRNVFVMKNYTYGASMDPTGLVVARFELTSSNATTKDTGSWSCYNEVDLVDGDMIDLAFAQHARTGTGTATITLDPPADTLVGSWLSVRRIR